jgi:DNA topoisomerase-6 subunit B
MMQKNAETMSKDHREISISQFFEKNRHLLGYDNKIKALLTIIKEAVDNSLDATEEAGILPELYVKIEELEKEKYRIVERDNGPGIVEKQVPKIFGKLLYGSKFHRLKQSRGQQGIGISGCALYAQLTTGEPTEIITSTGNGKTHRYILKIDVKTNEPKIIQKDIVENTEEERWHGVQVSFVVEGMYREHKQSVLEYLKETAISNPYAKITFDSPNGRVEFSRGVEELPPEPKEIKPHLYGVEVGIMSRMLHETKARTLLTFLTSEFSRVGRLSAKQIINDAKIFRKPPEGNLSQEPDINRSPKKVTDKEVAAMVSAVKQAKLTRPPTDCLSPLGSQLIEEGLKKELNPEFVAAITRSPEVYRGWPFQIEVGIAYGGSITETNVMRFANRVPLLYQSGDCAITKAVTGMDWKRYGLETSGKTLSAPVSIFVHMASVWVPFTSESKESIANYGIIIKEIKLALQDCARKLSTYLSGMRKAEWAAERKRTFEKYLSETAVALEELTGKPRHGIEENMIRIIGRNTVRIEAKKEAEEKGEEDGNTQSQ